MRAWDLVRYRCFRTLTTPQPVQFGSLAVDPGAWVRVGCVGMLCGKGGVAGWCNAVCFYWNCRSSMQEYGLHVRYPDGGPATVGAIGGWR